VSKRTTIAFAIAAFGAFLGLLYSSVSTIDFAAHMDRQLHPVSCTLLPGLTEASQLEESVQGCKVALFSPYSSFWRDRYWGGIPYSLPAMGLFGFALFLCIWAFATRRGHELAPILALIVSGIISVGVSLWFFYISLTELNTICTTCVGSYIGAGILLVGGALVGQFSRPDRWISQPGAKTGGTLFAWITLHALEMAAAVILPVLVFVWAQPDYEKLVSSCGKLDERRDRAGVILDVGGEGAGGNIEALIVLDPLCAACKAFHRRLKASRFSNVFSYRVLSMPLDAECNWMIEDSLYPGSCLLSKALLCAGDQADEMLEFIYQHQEQLRMDSIGGNLKKIRNSVEAEFPGVHDCLTLPDTKIKLNKALRFAVSNRLPIVTPQLYLDGRRVCDEDTDLGLDFTLARFVEAQARTEEP